MATRIALITGITGQTGSYLADLLVAKGYAVHGVIRRSSSFNTARIAHLYRDPHESGPLTLHYGDVTDALSLRRILSIVKPDEVYNLAAQSHVKVSFDQPVYSVETAAIGALNMLEAVRDYRDRENPNVRYYQASSSEMFGDSPPPQSETTAFRPLSPYACAKVYAFHQTVNYREAYGLFACNGILFNHESPRRGETFVTRKITRAASRIYYGLQDTLYLGNLASKRDWGFAGDYAEAIFRIVQHEKPDDFVVATGHSMTVQAWLALCFDIIGRDHGDCVEVDKRYFRPMEVQNLCGNAQKALKTLKWVPSTSPFRISEMMMRHDLEAAAREAHARAFAASWTIPPDIEARLQAPESDRLRTSRRGRGLTKPKAG